MGGLYVGRIRWQKSHFWVWASWATRWPVISRTKGGHDVTVYNRTAAKADKWVAQFGGRSANTPKEAAQGQDFVMACVGNDNDLREVMLGNDGAFHGMAKGALLVDHTTASAEIARELYAEAGRRGFAFHRCAGVRRTGGRGKWRADGDVRRRRAPRLRVAKKSSRPMRAPAR